MDNVNALRAALRTRSRAAGLVFGLAALAAGCAPSPPPFPELPRLAFSIPFSTKNMCGLGVSPAVVVPNPPEGTVRYKLQMTNASVLFQQPWQEVLPARPNGIPEGAAPDYPGPCPGDLQAFQYRFEVLALDAQNRPLAFGQTGIAVYPIDRELKRERANTGGTAASRVPPEPSSPIETPLPYARDWGNNAVLSPPISPALTPGTVGPSYGPAFGR